MLDGKLVLGWMPQGTGKHFPFDPVFPSNKDVLEHGFDYVDALVLWGGTDISPSYYKQKAHSKTQNQYGPSQRDKNEWKAMVYARAHNIPIIGVCRGAQYLCVFAGGKLIQHVDGHHGEHYINTVQGSKYVTTSCHHQMMYPWDVPHECLAWSSDNRSTIYEDENDQEITYMLGMREPEVVYFPRVNGLAIQGHPEWMKQESMFVKYLNDLVVNKLLSKEEEIV